LTANRSSFAWPTIVERSSAFVERANDQVFDDANVERHA
jgi:hypothetical protein